MFAYLYTPQVPETAVLSPQHQQLVAAQCMHPLLIRPRVFLLKASFLLPLYYLVFPYVTQDWAERWHAATMIALGVFALLALDQLFDMAVLSANRKSIAKFVSEHEQELR